MGGSGSVVEALSALQHALAPLVMHFAGTLQQQLRSQQVRVAAPLVPLIHNPTTATCFIWPVYAPGSACKQPGPVISAPGTV